MTDHRWVSAPGGAMDRVAVLCAVLLAIASAVLAVEAVVAAAPGRVVWWLVVLGLSLLVFRSARRRVRAARE